MRTLILSPHPDDCELTMGGTIQNLISQGKELKVLFFSDCNIVNVRDEIKCSMETLGVKRWYLLNYPRRTMDNFRHEIRHMLYEEKDIERVYCPSLSDVHQDHALIATEAVRAFNARADIIHYIQPKNVSKPPTMFSELSEEQLSLKIKALKCYKSQIRLRPKYFNEEAVRAVASFYGLVCGVRYAEAFEPYKILEPARV